MNNLEKNNLTRNVLLERNNFKNRENSLTKKERKDNFDMNKK